MEHTEVAAFFDELEKIALDSKGATKILLSKPIAQTIIASAIMGGLTNAYAGLTDPTPVFDPWTGGVTNPTSTARIGRAVTRGGKGLVAGAALGGITHGIMSALSGGKDK